MSKLIKVRHVDPRFDSKLGFGFITGHTQTVTEIEGKPSVVVFANVSWEKQRTPAISFHSLQELAWVEIEGVDEEGDLLANFDLSENENEDYADSETDEHESPMSV